MKIKQVMNCNRVDISYNMYSDRLHLHAELGPSMYPQIIKEIVLDTDLANMLIPMYGKRYKVTVKIEEE